MRQWAWPLAGPLLLATAVEAGGGSAWHRYQHEYDYCEDVLLIVFVFIALAFEVVWHFVQHSAKHSYRYGRLHDQICNELDAEEKDSHGNLKHIRLYSQLVSRMGGEFMTLGVLAFMIFVFNQAGWFKGFVTRFPSCSIDEHCFHLPSTESDLLHLAELAHVKLFLGMLLYFVLIFFLVRGSVHQIQDWEKLRLRLLSQRSGEVPTVGSNAMDKDLHKHMLWCDYFLERILGWRAERPALFQKVLEALHIDPRAEDIRRRIDERFSLSAYLALNLESGVEDSIQVHLQTWFAVIFLFSFFALLHRYAEIALMQVLPWFIAVAFALLLAMWLLNRYQKRKMMQFVMQCQANRESGNSSSSSPVNCSPAPGSDAQRGVSQNEPGSLGIHQRFATERHTLRVLQVFMFCISYAFATVMVDKEDWAEQFDHTLLLVLLFTVLFVVLAKFLPHMVPVFLAIMSFPPFVDDGNLAAFFKVLHNDHNRGLQRKFSGNGTHSETNLEDLAALAGGGTDQAAIWELANILGVGSELEQRLRARRAAVSSEPLAEAKATASVQGEQVLCM